MASEEKFSQFFFSDLENAKMGVFVLSEEKVLYTNALSRRLLGLVEFETIAGSDAAAARAYLQGKLTSFEFLALTRGSSRVWWPLESERGRYLFGFFPLEIDRRFEALLKGIHEAERSAGSFRAFYEAIYRLFADLVEMESFYIVELGKEGAITSPYFVDRYGRASVLPWVVPRSLTLWVARQRRPQLLEEEEILRLTEKGELPPHEPLPKSWLGVPLVAGDEVIGVLATQSNDPSYRYSEHDLALFSFAAEPIAQAISRKRQEETSKQYETLSRSLAELSSEPLFYTDLEGNILLANALKARLHGFLSVEGQNLFSLILPEEHNRTRTEIASLMQRGVLFGAEHQLLRKEGSVFSAALNTVLIRDSAGNPVGILGTTRTFPIREMASETSRRSRDYCRALLEMTPDTLLCLRRDGILLDVAPPKGPSKPIFGPEHWGKSISEVFPEYAPFFLEHVRRTLENGGIQTAEFTLYPEGTTPRFFEARFGVYDRESALVILREMTERRETEEKLHRITEELERHITERTEELEKRNEELRASNENMEEFVYSVSHDLQEPLRMILSYLQLLERRHGQGWDDVGREFFHYALDGAQRMQRMIHSLLEYARAGTAALHFTLVDCNELLASVRLDLGHRIAESGATLTNDPLPSLMGDPVQLLQVFSNLVGNALKFRSEEAPQVHVSARQNEGEWIFSVRDNGIGIDPEDHYRIFSVFQRLHTQAEYEGTGIGLALCKRIIERHGGRIWVESEPRRGSTFFFTIPDKRGEM